MRRLLIATLALAFVPPAAAQSSPLPRPLVADALRESECTLSPDEALADLPPAQDLGAGQLLIEIPCFRAAYNSGSMFFVVDPAAPGERRLLRFRVWNDKAFAERYSLTFGEYDPAERRMTSLHKGRGLGDCGSAGAWRWDGSDFMLEAYWLKENCDGELFDPFGEPGRWRVFPK